MVNMSFDPSQYYEGETIGKRFAPAEIAEAKEVLDGMIKESGLKGKLVSLIVRDTSLGARGTHQEGEPFVTLWGRAPIADEAVISKLIVDATEKLGNKVFHASDSSRVGPDDDILVAPFTLHSEAKVPPRTWT